MTRTDGPLLVLGVGNVLLRDEGVGVRVAREVEALGPGALPPGTAIVDGGTLGLDLLPLIEDAAALVLIDAVDLRAAPGAVRVLREDKLRSALGRHMSSHQVGIGDLLAAARLAGTLPEQVALVAIQPERVEIGLELTPAIEATVPTAVALVRDELAALAAGRGGRAGWTSRSRSSGPHGGEPSDPRIGDRGPSVTEGSAAQAGVMAGYGLDATADAGLVRPDAKVT